jgi:hypothetical protein
MYAIIAMVSAAARTRTPGAEGHYIVFTLISFTACPSTHGCYLLLVDLLVCIKVIMSVKFLIVECFALPDHKSLISHEYNLPSLSLFGAAYWYACEAILSTEYFIIAKSYDPSYINERGFPSSSLFGDIPSWNTYSTRHGGWWMLASHGDGAVLHNKTGYIYFLAAVLSFTHHNASHGRSIQFNPVSNPFGCKSFL